MSFHDQRTHLLPRCHRCSSTQSERMRYCGMCGARVRRDESLTGVILDDAYELGPKLAEGGFSVVYHARYIPTGDAVAVKVLRPELANDPIVAARFRREAKSLVRLRDRHTVATFESGETPEGRLYIVMELLEGQTLGERLASRGAMTWTEVLDVMRAVCQSLAEAHGQGLVHRDLKPQNIHVGTNGMIKVIDFGLAKLASDQDLTRAGQTVGTVPYMAPEQLVGSGCDARCDIYALGVVAYELLTGQRPYPDAVSADRLVSALLTRTPAPPSALSDDAVPTDVDHLLLRCLERDADARFATVDELRCEIERVLARRRHTPRPWLPNTPAFELEPARIVAPPSPSPAFVHDTELDVPQMRPPPIGAWLFWLACFLATGIGAGTVVGNLM